MKFLYHRVIQWITFALAGVVFTLVSARIPVDGIILVDLYWCGDPSGLPFAFTGALRNWPEGLPIPLCVPPTLLRDISSAGIFTLDSLVWTFIVATLFALLRRVKGRARQIFNASSRIVLIIFVLTTISGVHHIFAQPQKFDLANLRNQHVLLTKAYDIMKPQETWELVLDSQASVNPVVVGIVDTGVDASHQEFKLPNVNFGSSPPDALVDAFIAEGGHGTQVAGIIGANNRSAAEILPPESPQMNGILSGILREDQYTLEVESYRLAQTSNVFVALERVLQRDPSVVNMSVGAAKCSALPLLERKNCYKTDVEFLRARELYFNIFHATSNQDTLFVAAAGNNSIDTISVLPASLSSLENVMAVGATDLDDDRTSFSNFGGTVNISAPGIHVYAPQPGQAYEKPTILFSQIVGNGFNGTSAAAPLVTGVAAILKAIKPELTPLEIKQILVETADPIHTGETDERLGTGCYADPNDPVNTGCRLNALGAVQRVLLTML